jgi:2'-5' RNA ligase
METALILPVPQVETPAVRALRIRHDPSAAAGVGAHVTLLVPFLPAERVPAGELRAVMGAFAAIHVRFAEIRSFPGVLWLAPDPAEPILRLIRALSERYPEAKRHGGEIALDDVVPHLTLAMRDDEATRAEVEEAVTGLLPVEAVIGEAWLIAQDDGGRWHHRNSFPLGAQAA